MRKVIAAAFVSLDGVMQAPGGPSEDPTGGFTQGGWTVTYWDEAMGQFMDEMFATPFDLLLGRIEDAIATAQGLVDVDVLIPWDRSDLVNQFHRTGLIEHEGFEEGGTRLSGRMPERLRSPFLPFVVQDNVP